MKVVRILQSQLSFENIDVKDVVHEFRFFDGFVCLVVSSPIGILLNEYPFAHALCSPNFIEVYTQPCMLYVARTNQEKDIDVMDVCCDCKADDIHTLWAYLAEFERRYF